MTNILKPPGGNNFPYWPGLGIQQITQIPGQQMAGEVQDIPVNKSMYMLGYTSRDVTRVGTPMASQDQTGATRFIEGRPVMGVGAQTGLLDLLIQQTTPPPAAKAAK